MSKGYNIRAVHRWHFHSILPVTRRDDNCRKLFYHLILCHMWQYYLTWLRNIIKLKQFRINIILPHSCTFIDIKCQHTNKERPKTECSINRFWLGKSINLNYTLCRNEIFDSKHSVDAIKVLIPEQTYSQNKSDRFSANDNKTVYILVSY